MSKTTAALTLLFTFVILVSISSTSARPAKSNSLVRQKRQSDQRLAELETLLALQKYGRHRFRMDRKKGVGADGEHPPGYGLIDFRMLGRKKKSTRFSPGEFENSPEQIAADVRPVGSQENQRNLLWTSDDNNTSDNEEKEDRNTFSDDSPLQELEQHLPSSADQIGDLKHTGVVPLFYLQTK